MAKNQPKPIPQLTEAEIQRFWSKVDKAAPTACWLWTGHHRHPDGYGLLSIRRKIYGGHRLSYAIHKGHIPDGQIVRHKCDRPECVNPLHLELGTQLDNVHDRDARGRGCHGDKHYMRTNPQKAARHIEALLRGRREKPPRGIANPKAKLTDEQVVTLRKRFALGESQPKLAVDYGISRTMVCLIVRGKNWRHLPTFPRDEGVVSIGIGHKLTPIQVLEMRDRYERGGITYRQLAKEYSVGCATVTNAVNGSAWKHLPSEQ